MEVRTERDSAVEAIAWRVDPTATGALARQPSSADAQQGSSSVVSSASSDNSNMPPGFITPAASRANAADLIRGRGALRTLPISAQTAGTAVSLLPPQNAAGNNLTISLQAEYDRVRTSHAALRAEQQDILQNCRRHVLKRPVSVAPEAVAPVVANEDIDSNVTLPLQETAARTPQESISLVDTMSGAADTSSSMESDMHHWDMSTAESRAAWHLGEGKL